MALDQSVLSELLDALRAGGDLAFMREAMQLVLQALIDLEAEQHIGAARYERSETRTTQRNGTRARLLSTKAGDVELAIPKLRHGRLWAVIMEAFVHGVSTRKVDDLVAALGIDTGVSKSHVSRICADIDVAVGEFRERRVDHVEFPYLFLDATYVKAHHGAHVVSKAIVVATGVTTDEMREVLGLAVGDSEDTTFWTSFLRLLRARALGGVQLVISDAHQGLRAAIDTVIRGAAWQRCRVHFGRSLLARVPKASAEMVAAAIRTIFAQPDAAAVTEQLHSIADKLAGQFPDVAAMLRNNQADLCAFAACPTPTGARSGRPTPSSGSTKRSNDAPTSWVSSPTTPRSSASPAPSYSRSTTSGRSPTAATSPKPPWHSSPRHAKMTQERRRANDTSCSPDNQQHPRRRSHQRSQTPPRDTAHQRSATSPTAGSFRRLQDNTHRQAYPLVVAFAPTRG
jgi:putative transposase